MGGRTGKNKQRESNEMYHWLNYCPLYTPRQLNFIIFSFFFSHCAVCGAISGTLQWPSDPWRPGEHAQQPSRGAVHPLLRVQSCWIPQMGWRTNSARDPLAPSAEGHPGQPKASRTGPVTEGVESGMLWPEIGSDRVYEWTGLLVETEEETKDCLHPS